MPQPSLHRDRPCPTPSKRAEGQTTPPSEIPEVVGEGEIDAPRLAQKLEIVLTVEDHQVVRSVAVGIADADGEARDVFTVGGLGGGTVEVERIHLEAETDRTKEELERTEWLVTQEAIPAMRLREARATVAAHDLLLEQHNAASLSALRSGERDLQEVEAELVILEGRLDAALAALEVRSMVSGRVVSVRTVGSDRRGLDVEVVMLGEVGEWE